MSSTPHIQHTEIEVDNDVLPYPATKLVITQYLEATDDAEVWAWLIVGAFFDRDDNIIWSTEVFAAHPDHDSELDDSDGDDDQDDVESLDAELFAAQFSSGTARVPLPLLLRHMHAGACDYATVQCSLSHAFDLITAHRIAVSYALPGPIYLTFK
jgi:hypothetical protein